MLEDRQCCICYEIKSLTEYYPYTRNKTGIMACCKKCHNLRTQRSNNKYLDKRRPQRQEYNRTVERKIAAYENTKKMYIRHPEHQKARMKVYHAIKTGKLSKLPCSICGDSKVQGHHNDYAKPLEVNWLCVTHHKLVHKKSLHYK